MQREEIDMSTPLDPEGSTRQTDARWRRERKPGLAATVAMCTAAATIAGGIVFEPVPARAAKADVFALVGGRVVTVSGNTIESGVIILRDGVIEAIGAKVTVPVDARVIDAKGLTLTPGLIDAFGGLGLPAPRRAGSATAAGGVGDTNPTGVPATPAPPTSPLSPHAMALDKIRIAEALKARDVGVTTALVVGRDGVLPGKSVLINLAGKKPEDMVLRQPAAQHLHLTTISRQYPSSLMGTVAYARQSLYSAIRYRDEWAAYERAPAGKKRPRFDPALAAWQDVLSGKEMLIVTATRENDIRRALALADELKIRVAVAGAARAFRVADLVKARKLPLLVSVSFDPPRAVTSAAGRDEEKEKREIEEAEKNPAALDKAGVVFALGSGFAPSFMAGIRKAIDAGLPRGAALRALTLEAARALGVSDRTGSLEVGKLANVVAWAGDPLEKKSKVKMVFVDGQLYEPPDRPDRLDGDDKDDEEKPAPTEDDVDVYDDADRGGRP